MAAIERGEYLLSYTLKQTKGAKRRLHSVGLFTCCREGMKERRRSFAMTAPAAAVAVMSCRALKYLRLRSYNLRAFVNR